MSWILFVNIQLRNVNIIIIIYYYFHTCMYKPSNLTDMVWFCTQCCGVPFLTGTEVWTHVNNTECRYKRIISEEVEELGVIVTDYLSNLVQRNYELHSFGHVCKQCMYRSQKSVIRHLIHNLILNIWIIWTMSPVDVVCLLIGLAKLITELFQKHAQ